MKYLHIISLLFFQLIIQLCFCQTGPLQFIHLNTSTGLSQNTVFDILKDYRGFMWFATDEGLNKYDGYNFTVYKHDPVNSSTISSSSIYALLQDADNNLWVLTGEGLDKFDREKEIFIHISEGEKRSIFTNVFQDSKKRIWLGTSEKGFCLFDPKKNTFNWHNKNEQQLNSLSNNYVYKITEDNNENLWIGTRNGLNKYTPATGKFLNYQHENTNPKSIAAGYIKSVFRDRRGDIWAGTQGNGVALYNAAENSFTNFKHDPLNSNSICHNDILSFTEDASGKLWIGTENGGIGVLNPGNKTFTNYKNEDDNEFSLSGNSVYSLYKDDIGNIWAGTWSGGVNMLPSFGKKFSHYKKIPNNSNSLSNNLVLAMQGDAKNNVWVGTDGGGLNCFNTVTHQFTNYTSSKQPGKLFNNYVVNVIDYAPETLVLSFHRGGLDFFDVKKNSFKHYRPNIDLPNRNSELSISVVYKDKRNNLWLSNDGTGGIFLFDTVTKNFITFSNDPANKKSISSISVFAFLEDRSGQFWIGGDNGLDLFDRDKKEFSHYKHDASNAKSISSDMVLCITEDRAGNLWLGTDYGLNYFDKKTQQFKTFTEKDGLPNNIVSGILEDKNGKIWLSTNRGISKFDPVSGAFRNFTINDGLQSNTFNRKAAYKAADGQLFFGGENGFNAFYPDSLRDNNFVPPVYITGLEVFNKPVGLEPNSPLQQSISETKEITFSYGQSVFTLLFSALNFNHPDQNKYAYKLEGFDKEWSYVGNKRSATYTNLNPGTYYFNVKGSNNDGIWNEKATTIKIIIKPPFWLTWWFIALIAAFVAGCIIAVYRFKMAIINKQKILLQQTVKEQTLQLVNLNEEERNARVEAERSRTEAEMAWLQAHRSNKELQLKNKELEQFAYVASHDLQEPLRTTAGFVGLLQKHFKNSSDEKVSNYLAFIADASNRMKTLIKDLLDFSRIGNKVELVETDCNKVVETMLVDISAAVEEAGAVIEYTALPVLAAYPTELKMLFQNLVINAIKFRKKTIVPFIKLSAVKSGNYWQFSVSDNGIGIEKEHTSRIFDIFQRLHTRTEYEGSGIGLSHCKKIAELHHGRIWVTAAPGEGSTFHFTILIQQPSDS